MADPAGPSAREKAFPLGATWDELATNFPLFFAHATKIELALFGAWGGRELERIEISKYTDEVWREAFADSSSQHRLRRAGARNIRS